MNVATQTEPVRQVQREQDRTRSLEFLFHQALFRRLFDDEHEDDRSFSKEVEIAKNNQDFLCGRNEFADQIGLALVWRLRHQNFPTIELKHQHRIRKSLTRMPNKRLYLNKMSLNPDLKAHPDNAAFQALLRRWLRFEGEKVEWSSIFIKASKGKGHCVKERGTTESKWNHRNVDLVTDLVISNYKAKAVKARDIVILTQYADQVRLYEKNFNRVAGEEDVDFEISQRLQTLIDSADVKLHTSFTTLSSLRAMRHTASA